MRQVAVRHRHRAAQRSREVAQSRAEDDGDLRDVPSRVHARSNRVGRFLDAVVILHHRRKPAIVAVMKFASVPANMARRPSRARSCRRFGASAPMPPIWLPIELKFAKPHSANVAIVIDLGSRTFCLIKSPSAAYATNSLSTMRVPSRLPIVAASFHGTPILHATGEKTQPKTRSRLSAPPLNGT